jgi:hypothetical protein
VMRGAAASGWSDVGDFMYSQVYGKSKGGIDHLFKLSYASGAPHPRQYDFNDGTFDGHIWKSDDKRYISIVWECDAYESPCRPTITGRS